MNKKNLMPDKRDLIFKHDVFNIIVKNSIEETTMFFYGELGFVETNYQKIKATVTNALNQNQNITIRINSYSGSIIEGIAVYDLIKSFPNNVTVIVEGVVSDFTIPIALSGDKILMSKNAYFNLESIKEFVIGSKDAISSMSDKLELAGNTLFEIFKTRVIPFYQEEIKGYLNNTNGVWLDSTTCRKMNLCDEIILPTNKRGFQEDEIVSAMILHPENNVSIDISASKFLEDRNNWSFRQWQEKDPKGIEKLAMRFPNTFDKLFNAEYRKQEIENN